MENMKWKEIERKELIGPRSVFWNAFIVILNIISNSSSLPLPAHFHLAHCFELYMLKVYSFCFYFFMPVGFHSKVILGELVCCYLP